MVDYIEKTQSRRGGVMRTNLIAAALAVLALVAACSDDGGPDKPWRTTVRVTDHEGNRVAGLELMILMDSDYYQDGLAQKAAVSLRWYQPVACRTAMSIENAAGARVRGLTDQMLPAGSHIIMWDGRDDDGVHAYSGLYYARLMAWDEGDTLLYEATAPMFLAMMDFDQATLGVTDADGGVTLTDRTVFPHLYDDPGMVAVDENGEAMGEFPLTSRYRFYLRDPRYGHAERVDLDVGGTEAFIDVPWMGVDGSLARKAAETPPPVGDPKPDEPPIMGFIFYGPMPNPFN
jgi:hypothetical protein